MCHKHNKRIINTCNAPVDGTDARHVLLCAHVIGEQTIADLPREHGRVVALVVADCLNDVRCRHLRFGTSNHARFYGAGLVISTEVNIRISTNI